MHMRHVLRQLGQLVLGGATPKVGAGLLTLSATLASALWVSVSVPNLPLLRGLDDRAGTSVAISLQSALLGIDDRKSRGASPRALAHELGLSERAATLFASGGGFSLGAAGDTSRTAAGPLVARLAPSVAADAAAPSEGAPVVQQLTFIPGQAAI